MRSGVVDGLHLHTANGINLRTLTVELLTGETILISTEGKTTCSAIWNRVQGELVARGVIHPQIFGLAIKTGFDWVFVDPDAKVSKYFAKDWKTTTPGSSINESKTLIFYCRVHFYLESIPINFDIVSLLHYYLQLRQNLTTTSRRYSTNFNLLQPLAYAYQSELGDWAPCQESPSWTQSLVPMPGVSSAAPMTSLTIAHQALVGFGQIAARTAFIRSLIPTYNMHLYGMTLRTKDGKDTQAWIGVTPKGIDVYQNELGRNEIPEQPKITFLWANITKLYFERKKFEIRGRACSCGGSTTEKLSFTSWSEAVPRHLLLLCRSTHQFHLSNHKILMSSSNNGTGGGDYKTSSSSTSTGTMSSTTSTSGGGDPGCNSALLNSKNDDKMLDLSLWADGLLLPNGNESSEHQRVSVISNASSNTTSGIVSDRVYSLDGSEEELDLRISDCCTNHIEETNNSTSLESLSHKQRSHHHNLSKSHHSNGIPKNHHLGVPLDVSQRDETEAKYWYCDSDCEDDCDTGPCRSLLVRTINDGGGEKDSCAAFCECNSCLVDEDEFERDSSSGDSSSNQLLVHHHNTPSLASEKTLKALDISAEAQPIETNNKMEEVKSQEKNEDDPSRHVYGEICEEDPKTELKNGRHYSRMENDIISPIAKPRSLKSESVQDIGIRNHRNEKHHGHCEHKKTTDKSNCNTSVTSAKETTGLTPRVASLKCLRTQRAAPWSLIKSSKNDYRKGSLGSLDEADGCYVDFDKKLQQGRYPSTRTVSDNFDTDSDYVQLPPLHPRPPPPKRPTTSKLWKFVNIRATPYHKSCGNVVDEVAIRSPSLMSPNVTNALPRRNPLESSQETQREKNLVQVSISKTMSKSTTAINTILQEERPPQPPPKPKKVPLGSEYRITTKPVDARFITSKPQILIQTAYATPATIAVPSQSQILYRGSHIPSNRRTQSHIVQPTIKHSQSMDNIYDTVASEDTSIMCSALRQQVPLPPLPPPLLPKPSSSPSVIIRPNNYIDVHASSPARNNKNQIVGSTIKGMANVITSSPSSQPGSLTRGKCPSPVVVAAPITTNAKTHSGSVPNNLHTFYVGLQNLKPLSRAPIVYPTATGCSTINPTANIQQQSKRAPSGTQVQINPPSVLSNPYSRANVGVSASTTSGTGKTSKFTTVYTSQLTRSQIQQFKAQLYSDMDYVIFPPKDPRVSQQEYYDSKSLSLTTMTSTNSNPMLSNAYSLNEIPPPYLPPPPPYPYDPRTVTPSGQEQQKIRKPPKPLPGTPATSVTSLTAMTNVTLAPFQLHNSYTSLYNAAMSSNASQGSSSYYGGYYAVGAPNVTGSSTTLGLNAENLQKFLSTQNLSGSHNFSSPPPPIYYPASTHSAPPLPPYKNSRQVLIENGMKKAVERLMAKDTFPSVDRTRMKLLSRSEESLYSQPLQETEEKLQAIYNLPPPPPYKNKSNLSPSEVDLTSLRQKCTTMELPLLKALLNSSDGALMTKPSKVRPTAHAHPNLTTTSKEEGNEVPPPARPPKPAKLRPPQHQQSAA